MPESTTAQTLRKALQSVTPEAHQAAQRTAREIINEIAEETPAEPYYRVPAAPRAYVRALGFCIDDIIALASMDLGSCYSYNCLGRKYKKSRGDTPAESFLGFINYHGKRITEDHQTTRMFGLFDKNHRLLATSKIYSIEHPRAQQERQPIVKFEVIKPGAITDETDLPRPHTHHTYSFAEEFAQSLPPLVKQSLQGLPHSMRAELPIVRVTDNSYSFGRFGTPTERLMNLLTLSEFMVERIPGTSDCARHPETITMRRSHSDIY